MTTIPMHPVDAAWFHMDGAVNTAVVTALLTARRAFDADAVKRVLARRLAPLPAFRRCVADAASWSGAPAWIEADSVDIDQHVHRVALPPASGTAGLRELVADLASQPLPLDLPLWQVHVVDGPGTSGALVFRYHHCLGDGAAMMAVAGQVFDDADAPGAAVRAPAAAPGSSSAATGVAAGFARLAVEGIGALLADLAKTADPPTAFKSPLTSRQRLAWSRTLDVDRLKGLAHVLHAKLNDLAVSAIAGALRGYLVERGQAGEGMSLRAMVPVNLRGTEGLSGAANQFGLVILDLPVDRAMPLDRLRESSTRMSALKASAEPFAMHELFDLFGRGPRALQHVAQSLLGSKASLVLTNVPGPTRPLRLAGRTIARMLFWVPHPGNELGLGVSVCSYRGQLTFGVIADARRVPDPERIVRAIEREIDALDRAAPVRRPRRRRGQPSMRS